MAEKNEFKVKGIMLFPHVFKHDLEYAEKNNIKHPSYSLTMIIPAVAAAPLLEEIERIKRTNKVKKLDSCAHVQGDDLAEMFEKYPDLRQFSDCVFIKMSTQFPRPDELNEYQQEHGIVVSNVAKGMEPNHDMVCHGALAKVKCSFGYSEKWKVLYCNVAWVMPLPGGQLLQIGAASAPDADDYEPGSVMDGAAADPDLPNF